MTIGRYKRMTFGAWIPRGMVSTRYGGSDTRDQPDMAHGGFDDGRISGGCWLASNS